MLTIHAVVDNATNAQLDMVLDYLVATNQRIVNIAAGSQIDRGMQFVERVRAAMPNIDIIWRILEDTGIHAQMSVEVWWTLRVQPFLAWMKKNRVIMLLDNESSGDDAQIRYYVQWEIDALKRLHKEGLYGAVARFATGNIDDGGQSHNQYPLLKPLFDAVTDGDYVSPNEYTNTLGLSSGGNVGRWKLLEDAAGRKLRITIGEAGILHRYEADNGWQGHMTELEVVLALLADEAYYRPDIDRAMFCVGGYGKWNTLQITQGILNLLKEYYKDNPPMTEIIARKNLITTGTVNLRSSATTAGAVVKKIVAGSIPVSVIGTSILKDNYHWQHIQLDSGEDGYVALEVVVFTDIANTPSDNSVSLDKLTLDDAKMLITEVQEDMAGLQTKLNAVLIKLQTAK